jgi:cyclase
MYLVELAQGVMALVDEQQGYGYSNVGLVIDHDGLTIIDTSATPERAASVKAELNQINKDLGLPLKRVVLTSSRVPFTGGSSVFWQAAFYGSEATSDQLDAPVNSLALRRLLPHLAEAYTDDFATRSITHTVDEPAFLTAACFGVPLPGEAPANLIVQLPNAGVVFGGALASFGVTPLAFDGDPAAWAVSLREVLKLGDTVVPGHGPPGGAIDVQDLIGYLEACVEVDGDTTALPAGPWDAWSDRRFDAVNVERAARLARGDNETPHAMFRLLGFG